MSLKLNIEKFKSIGGGVSLDFVNTVSGRISNPNKKGEGRDYLDFTGSDKLENYADLMAWSLKTKLFDEKDAKLLLQLAEHTSRAAKKVFRRALILRESI